MTAVPAGHFYECPACFRVTRWTDGQAVELGDDVDEFWCQVCGAESPLAACHKVARYCPTAEGPSDD